MPYRIRIDFDIGELDDPEYGSRTFRVWNFGEDLFYAFRDSDLATISLDDVDRAASQLRVKVKSRSKVRRVVNIIDKLLGEHFPDSLGRLTVEHLKN